MNDLRRILLGALATSAILSVAACVATGPRRGALATTRTDVTTVPITAARRQVLLLARRVRPPRARARRPGFPGS